MLSERVLWQISGRADDIPERKLLFEALRALLLLISLEKPLPFSEDGIITDTLGYIGEHFSEKLTISELSARVGFVPEHFIRRFSKVIGRTPMAYIRDLRLMRAEELLLSGETLASAAEKVGYANATGLSKALSASRRTTETFLKKGRNISEQVKNDNFDAKINVDSSEKIC